MHGKVVEMRQSGALTHSFEQMEESDAERERSLDTLRGERELIQQVLEMLRKAAVKEAENKVIPLV